MSWREREFPHESEAYFRSLDQTSANSAPLEACMGGHIEKGKTVTDWVKCRGKRVTFRYLGPDANHVYVEIEGIKRPYHLRIPKNGTLISATRKLAEKALRIP